MAPGAKCSEDAVRGEHSLLDRTIVGEHGDGHRAFGGLARSLGEMRALGEQRLGLGRGPVINGERVTSGEQARRHAASHAPKSDEADLHRALPPSSL